jgi:hypothetical protein
MVNDDSERASLRIDVVVQAPADFTPDLTVGKDRAGVFKKTVPYS